MIVDHPEFSHGGTLLFCEQCPWHENGCPRRKCPTKETYSAAATAATMEVQP